MPAADESGAVLIRMADLPPALRYQWMTQAVIPRPVAWVLSENDGGDYNLAPFSYFNALASAPPLVGVSFGAQEDGGSKDTLQNIRRRGVFVVHIAGMARLEELNASAATLPYGESEVAALQLETVDFGEGFALPRLHGVGVALACRLHAEHALGAAQTLVIGEIVLLYAGEEVLAQDAKGRRVIDAAKVAPVGRLSAGKYAGIGRVVSLERPK